MKYGVTSSIVIESDEPLSIPELIRAFEYYVSNSFEPKPVKVSRGYGEHSQTLEAVPTHSSIRTWEIPPGREPFVEPF